MIAERITPTQTLIPVATGKAMNGNPFEITLAAYAVGREDAEMDEVFAPEMLYVHRQDLYEYALGFLAIRPDCVPAEELAQQYKPMPEPDYDPDEIDHPWQAHDWNRPDADYTDLPF